MADIAGLRAKLGQADANLASAEAEYARLKAAANSSNFAKDANGQVLDVEGFRAARAAASQFRTSTLEPAAAEASDAALALQNAERTDNTTLPTASAGQYVTEEQKGRANDALVSDPPSEPVVANDVENLTDEQIQQRLVETGTDGRIRPTVETQATPPAYEGETLPYAPAGDEDAQQAAFASAAQQGVVSSTVDITVAQDPGAGAGNEDSGSVTKNSTVQSIDNTFNQGKIIPQANILDQYASYTWQASLYLMSPEDYKKLMSSKKKIIPGNQLLIQSGGAPIAGRNTYFSNDYYIDRITLRSAITGKGTNAAHNVNDVKMTILEPNGITLIPNLDSAVQGYLGSAQKKKTNFTSAIYLLVIRFYGYDDAGNLVRGGASTIGQGVGTGDTSVYDNQGTSGGGAFVEKFYPITINKIDFKVTSKMVEYEITATAVQQQIATGSARGTIPYNVELGGMTVGEALNGPLSVTGTQRTGATPQEQQERDSNQSSESSAQDVQTPAPRNAAAAINPKITVRQGLAAALNQFQQELVKKGVYTVADSYAIEFSDAALEQAKIQVSNPEKTATGSAAPTTANQKLNPATNSVDNKSRNISVLAGTQIVQLIDQVMKNSTYITDQALVTRSEQGLGQQKSNGKPGDNVASYKINMTATPKKYDPKRNDYAYDIKYVITPYKVVGLVSDYFQIPKFNGAHKQYNYWFTGENTQVLSYEQTYNALYYTVLSGSTAASAGSIVQEAIKTSFQPNSGESSQGAKNAVNEIGANFADYLYNPGDLANATIKIVGDPAWLQQGDIDPVTKGNFKSGPFLPDGTINFESQQILFEILINTPDDYNLDVGLMDPNVRKTVFQNNRKPGAARQSYVYIANDCVSEFNKGTFTQTLKGSLLTYFPDQTFKDQQSQGRSKPVPDQIRSTTNPGAVGDSEWVEENGLNVLREDLPSDETDESEPISLNDPQPQPDPEPVTSEADIEYIESEGDPVLLNSAETTVPEPDYMSGLAGTTSGSQLMDRET